MKAKFIVVEGLEGAGKSTAIATIMNLLTQHGIRFITTREPGGTEVGEKLRAVIKAKTEQGLASETELLLMYAARVELINQVIKPALANDTWVIADRFELSSFAYQGAGRKLDSQFIQALSTFCVNGLKPDLTLYLDINPKLGMERVGRRGDKDRIESESLNFFERIRQCYLERVAADSNAVSIDASLPLNEVEKSISQSIEQGLL